MRVFIYAAALAVLLVAHSSVANTSNQEVTHTEVIEAFMSAFNAHDADAMSNYVSEDIQWLSVSADSVAVETKGKDNLVAAMANYFKSCVSCQSELIESMASAERVSTLEEASWEVNGTAKSQRSMAVYEFDGDLIQRVYYFPAEQ